MLLPVITIFLSTLSLSPSPGWPDAQGYANHIEAGHWVAHPPGYLAFMVVSRIFYLMTENGYQAAVLSSFFLSIFAVPCVAQLCKKCGGQRGAYFLGLAFSVSWLPVLLATTGTPHSGDLLFVSLLLLVLWKPGFQEGHHLDLTCFFALLWLTATFRLTTFIMWIPSLLVVIFWHRHRPKIWVYTILTATYILILQQLVAFLSGDPEEFARYAASMHSGNSVSSVLLSGVNLATSLNAFRSCFWTALATIFIGLITLTSFRHLPRLLKKPIKQDLPSLALIVTFLSIVCPIGLTSLYLTTHPGYMAPAIPGIFALAAFACRNPRTQSYRMLPWAAMGSALFWILLWFLPLFIPKPGNPWQASWNAFVGQYTREARQQSTWLSLSGWLEIIGRQDLISPERLQQIKDKEGIK
jgi:hypothetical protein